MNWLEILWACFWLSLWERQHERPFRRAAMPAPDRASRCRAAWKETVDMVRNTRLLPQVAGWSCRKCAANPCCCWRLR